MRAFIFISIALLLYMPVLSQEYGYKHYTIKEGLPQSQVTSLYQDSKGYLWIGTKMGLTRFDGHEFQNFYQKDGLLSDFICGFIEVEEKGLYILTKKGFCLYRKDSIMPYPVPANIKVDWKPSIIYYKGCFYFSTKQRLYSFNLENHVYKPLLSQKDYKKIIRVNSIYFDKTNNSILIGTQKGIYHYSNNKLTYLTAKDKHSLEIAGNNNGQLFVFDNNNIYTLQEDTLEKFMSIDFPEPRASEIFTSKEHDLMVFKRNYFYISVIEDGQYKEIPNKFSQVNDVLVDDRSNIWVGTETGLFKLFPNIFINYTSKNSGIFPAIYSIAEDRNNMLWFFGYQYGSQIFSNNGFKEKKHHWKPWRKALNYHMGAMRTHDGGLLAPISNGFMVLERNNHYLVEHVINGNTSATFCLLEDRETNRIYSGGSRGVCIFDSAFNCLESIPLQPGNQTTGSVTTIIKDTTGRFWLGGYNGLSFHKNGQIEHLPNKIYNYKQGAIDTYKDDKGNIWLGASNGLYFFDYKGFHLIKHPKIPLNIVTLVGIGSKKLFFGSVTNFGEMALDKFYNNNEISIKTYDNTNGFMGIECMQNGMYLDSKGYLWIPTTDRVVKYDPAKTIIDTIPPKLYIQKLCINKDSAIWETYCNTIKNDTIYELDYNQNNIRITYTGIYHSAPERVEYKVKLEGLDTNWTDAGKERIITYNRLKPGKYKFHVKACNEDGYWSKPVKMQFKLVPAYWQTAWFFWLTLLLAIILVVFITYLIFRRTRKAKWEKMKTEKSIAEFRLQTIKNQVDPHFTFNALNSMSYSILQGNREIAYDHMGKLSTLVRYSLEHADITIRPLKIELDFVKNYLDIQQYRFENRFSYSIQDNHGADLNVNVPKMVLQNHVENAVKHGLKHRENNGLLTIEVKQNNPYINIIIKDNGIGRKKAKEIGEESTGKGLKTLQEFYNLFNRFNEHKMQHKIEDLYDNHGKALGTKVTITIPVDYRYELEG